MAVLDFDFRKKHTLIGHANLALYPIYALEESREHLISGSEDRHICMWSKRNSYALERRVEEIVWCLLRVDEFHLVSCGDNHRAVHLFTPTAKSRVSQAVTQGNHQA